MKISANRGCRKKKDYSGMDWNIFHCAYFFGTSTPFPSFKFHSSTFSLTISLLFPPIRPFSIFICFHLLHALTWIIQFDEVKKNAGVERNFPSATGKHGSLTRGAVEERRVRVWHRCVMHELWDVARVREHYNALQREKRYELCYVYRLYIVLDLAPPHTFMCIYITNGSKYGCKFCWFKLYI